MIIVFLIGLLLFQSGYKKGSNNFSNEMIAKSEPIKKTNLNNDSVVNNSSDNQKNDNLPINQSSNYASSEFLNLDREKNLQNNLLLIRSSAGHIKSIALSENIKYLDKDNKEITLEEFKKQLALSQAENIEVENKDIQKTINSLLLNISFKIDKLPTDEKLDANQVFSIKITREWGM